MAKFEISVLEYGTDYKELVGIYEGENAFEAVKAYAKDAGCEIPTDENTDIYGLDARFEWGQEYPWDESDLTTKPVNIGHREFNAVVEEVETGDYLDFAVFDYKTGNEFFRSLMEEDENVRYDADNNRHVFYNGAKDYWERVHEDVARSEQLKKILAEELNADMSEINEKLDEECAGINDLDELESVKRAVLEDIYEHWND